MALRSTLTLAHQNRELEADIARKLKLVESSQSQSTTKRTEWLGLSANDIQFVKRWLKQTWQLRCMSEYLKVLAAIVGAVARKHAQPRLPRQRRVAPLRWLSGVPCDARRQRHAAAARRAVRL